MEFFIKQNATLPVLKMQIVKDGRSDYVVFMDQLEVSTIPVEYYVYFQFTSTMTNTPGRYVGQFLIKNDEGNLILPIREELYINVQPSFISESPCC